MKKNIFYFCIVLAFLICSCASKSKKSAELDPDDMLPGRVVVSHNEDSTPQVVLYYKTDEAGNPTREKIREVHYFPGKKKYAAGDIKNNQRNGKWFAYFENGNVNTEAFYIDGKENGEYKVYHENGILYYSGHYDMGTCIGTWKFYTPDGKLEKTLVADNNDIICGSCPRCMKIATSEVR